MRATTGGVGRTRVSGSSAFSLIELVVVLAVLGVLIGLILAGVQRVRDAATRAACASNLRQLALAIHLHADTHHRFPKGCDEGYSLALAPPQLLTPGRDHFGVGLSWHTSILPQIERADLRAQIDAAHKADWTGQSAPHDAVKRAVIPVFLCPADGRRAATNALGELFGLASYSGVAGTGTRSEDGLLHVDLVVRPTDVTDGLSNTLLLGERPPGPDGTYGGWYANWGTQRCPLAQILAAGPKAWIPSEAVGCPAYIPPLAPGRPDSYCSVGHFWSLHANGANFAFADGSVKFLRHSSAPILPALATRSGGETIDRE